MAALPAGLKGIRDMLGRRRIRPEKPPPSEDIKKLERRVKSQEKKLASQAGKLPEPDSSDCPKTFP